MRKLLFCTALALLAAGCKDGGGTSSSVATTVTVTPGTVSMNAIGATQVVHAAVADQKGKAMRNASLSWSSSSGAVTVSGAGGDSAIVTAVGNGTASITATSGSAAGSASVQVAQAASMVQKAAGDGQTGAAGTALPQPVTVGVRDRLGQPVAGVSVSFLVVGGGSVSSATTTTGANGNAAVTWTLGAAAGSTQQVIATTTGVGDLTFVATAVAGPAASASIAAGNNQTASLSGAVAVAPAVLVRDAFANPVSGVQVNFAVSSGGGSVTGGTATTDANGVARAGTWTLGSTLGANTLTATFPGTSVPPVVFNATAANAGTSTVQAGNNQGAMAGTAVPTVPSVLVRDGGGNPLSGLQVTFTVTGGGGSVGTATATTNASGVATPGSWTLGPDGGPNTLRATVAGITGAPATFRAIGCTGGGAGYTMTLCFTTAMSATQRAAFVNAANRWSSIITADLPDVPFSLPAGDCGDNSPAMNQTFDDLVLFAGVESIDGPSGILGQAGPCYIRGSAGLPFVGVMIFDVADMNGMEASGSLNAVILHEMGHVLGIGTLWSLKGLLQNPSSGGASPPDTYYSGAQGIVGFDAIGGTGYTAGLKVPVENTGGPGTRNGHWRESVLGRELMTGFINSGSNPLSVLTIRSLMDLGYTVNVAQADAFTLTFTQQNMAGTRLHLLNDIYTGPRFSVDRDGRRRRIQ